MGRKPLELSNKKFGKLTVIKRADKKGRNSYWDCICECGEDAVVSGSNLIKSVTTSCGCQKNRRGKRKENLFVEKDGYYEVYDVKNNMFLIDKGAKPLMDMYYWYMTEDGYIKGSIVKKYLHRFLTKAGKKDTVDHINGTETVHDNRFSNLRKTSRSTNSCNGNAHKDGKTGVLGVKEKKGRYIAEIMTKGKSTYLGSFETIEEAINARKKAELEQRGELSYFWKNSPHL